MVRCMPPRGEIRGPFADLWPARGVVLVALTGRGQDEDKRRSRGAGFDVHLTKLIDPSDLQRLLADLGLRKPGPWEE